MLLNTSYNLSILENKKSLYKNIVFKEKIELDLFCELFNINKEDMSKYQMKFEFNNNDINNI